MPYPDVAPYMKHYTMSHPQGTTMHVLHDEAVRLSPVHLCRKPQLYAMA